MRRLSVDLSAIVIFAILSVAALNASMQWWYIDPRDSTHLFQYLRPSWRTVEEFLDYCSDFDGSEGDFNLTADPALRALRPLFRSCTFAEAERALRKYHRAIARQRRAQLRHRASKRKGNAQRRTVQASTGVSNDPHVIHGASYTCTPWKQPMPPAKRGGERYRIAVLSTATGPYEDIYSHNTTTQSQQIQFDKARNASLDDRQRYCERHGYSCHIFDNAVKGRAAGWYRMPAVLALLGRNEYDWIFYLDLDAVILDHSIRLEEFLDPRFDIIIGIDRNGVNNGVFFMRNSTWSRMFYAEAWTRTHEPQSGWWAEQAAIAAILQERTGARNHVKVMPHAYFNTYLADGENKLPANLAGAFIIHFAGRKNKWGLVQRFLVQKTQYADKGRRWQDTLLDDAEMVSVPHPRQLPQPD